MPESRGPRSAPRLKFAVVREDPDLEGELVERLGARAALLVASGGCTALTLAQRFPALEVTAFDQNPAQVAHVRAKLEAALARDARALNVLDDSPAGLNQCGEFEGLFRQLRRFIEEFVAPAPELAAFFDPARGGPERAALLERWKASSFWRVAFELHFDDRLLHALFGPDATQHAVPGSYPGYFRRVFERGLGAPGAAQNPFLQHVLLGKYLAPAAPPYLRLETPPRLELLTGSLEDVPALERFSLYSLSNIFDWSPDSLVASWASLLARRARPGSAVLVRALNNERDVRRAFEPHFRFDDALGASLLARDRSLFYNRVEVAFRTGTPA